MENFKRNAKIDLFKITSLASYTFLSSLWQCMNTATIQRHGFGPILDHPTNFALLRNCPNVAQPSYEPSTGASNNRKRSGQVNTAGAVADRILVF